MMKKIIFIKIYIMLLFLQISCSTNSHWKNMNKRKNVLKNIEPPIKKRRLNLENNNHNHNHNKNYKSNDINLYSDLKTDNIINKNHNNKINYECSICLGSFNDKKEVIKCPKKCACFFCFECIEEYNKNKKKCPHCKTNWHILKCKVILRKGIERSVIFI